MSLHLLGATRIHGGGGGGGGHGGGHGGGGHGGGHGGGGYRGGFYGPGWGYGPYMDVIEIDDDLTVDDPLEVDALADAVVAKLSKKKQGEDALADAVARKLAAKTLVGDDAQYFDLAAISKKLNEVFNETKDGYLYARPVAAGTAQVIASTAMLAAKAAVKYGKGTDSKRQLTVDKLQWHIDNAKRMAPSADYPSCPDLRTWATQAFVEFNAAMDSIEQTEKNTIGRAIWEAIQELPVRIRDATAAVTSAVGTGVKSGIESAVGMPLWGVGLLAVGVLGVLGVVARKLTR